MAETEIGWFDKDDRERIKNAVKWVEQYGPHGTGNYFTPVGHAPPLIYGRLTQDLAVGGSATIGVYTWSDNSNAYTDSGFTDTVYNKDLGAIPTGTYVLALADIS